MEDPLFRGATPQGGPLSKQDASPERCDLRGMPQPDEEVCGFRILGELGSGAFSRVFWRTIFGWRGGKSSSSSRVIFLVRLRFYRGCSTRTLSRFTRGIGMENTMWFACPIAVGQLWRICFGALKRH